jgi:MFS-type transporter involved in bile tolerance (Atg22 family)
MGPGYFPTALGAILFLFGLYVLARGIRSAERVKGTWGARALALTALSILLFGFLLDRAGMVPAIVVTTLVAAAAGREFRLKEVLLLAVVLSVFSAAVFSYGLKLPYPLVGGY